MPFALQSLVSTAQRLGFATGTGTMETIRGQAQFLRMTEIPNRRAGPPVTTLRPVSVADARENSLSAKYGTGEQPLHTDGAHLARPPDIIVLISDEVNGVPTRTWRPFDSGNVTVPTHLEHGIFLVSNGKDSFFAPAYDGLGIRYDPGCMTPCDSRARQAAKFFDQALASATEHLWDSPNKVLVIDNRRVLHARAEVDGETSREIQRLSLLLPAE